jgi:hypothetical protein
MAKIGEVRPAVVGDARADSTLDRPADPVSALDAIAAEEIAENEAVAAEIEANAQAEADAAMAELVAGWQEAMNHAADVATSIAQELKPIWTKERMNNVGAALARCDAHYGWGGAAKLISHPLVGLGVAAAPVVIGTVKWAQVEKAKARAAAIEARRQSVAGAPASAIATPPAEPPKTGKAEKPVDVAAAMDGFLAAA